MLSLQDNLRSMTTPVITPFNSDKTLELEIFESHLHTLINAGISTLFPCGTTGEFASLSREERVTLIDTAVDVAPSDISVIAGGAPSAVTSAREWVETIASLGVDAAVITAPQFHSSNDPMGIEHFFEAIATDSPIPLLLYNIPACTGERIPPTTAVSLADHDSIIGLKDSGGDISYGLRILDQTSSEFLVLQGYDPLLIPSLRMGFDGGVNALSNVIPELYVEASRSPTSERARTIHRGAIEPLFNMCRQDGFAPVVKAALHARNQSYSATVRPPLVEVTSAEISTMINRVRQL
mgnify:FL=1|jgi:4-hydroxy-tetrahydrodipicolinate synthase